MIVLADSDILLKLARCDLFDEFLVAFAATTSDVRVLRAARFAIRSKKQRLRLGDESFARLTVFLDALADIEAQPNPDAIAALTEQADKNIDAGEAALFAIGPSIPESVIMTGDKKSLAGLMSAAEVDGVCEALCQSLAGRLYCFEQILFRILDQFGFDAVRQRLIDGRECDRGLALWLGSGLDANEATFREGLTSYLNEARRASGVLLAP